MGLRDEILEQPAVLRGLLETQLGHVEQVAQAIRQRDVEYVFIAARGTSDHAGVYAQYVWGTRNRLPVALAAPSLFSIYESSPRLGRALVVGISQSGRSPDVVSVIVEARRQGALTLAITNDLASALAQSAEFNLDIRAGRERAVAATKTYTATLLILAALSVSMQGDEDGKADLWRVPDAVRETLAAEEAAQRIAAGHAAMTECVVLGRGYNYPTAQEWALKLKELTYVLADPYSTADFQHGPIAIVEPGFPVLAIGIRGPALADMLSLLRRLQSQHGAELTVISDDDEALGLAHAALRVPSLAPEWLTPILSIVPAQLYCYHLTRAKGYDPEAPRGLRKVTLTR